MKNNHAKVSTVKEHLLQEWVVLDCKLLNQKRGMLNQNWFREKAPMNHIVLIVSSRHLLQDIKWLMILDH